MFRRSSKPPDKNNHFKLGSRLWHNKAKPEGKHPELEAVSVNGEACKICSKIVQSINSSTRFNIPFIDVKRNVSCSACRVLTEAMLSRLGEDTPEDATLQIRPQWPYWEIKIDGPEHPLTLLQVGRSTSRGDIGLLPGDQLIDRFLLEQWAQRCDDQHSDVCHSFRSSWETLDSASSLILIDVNKKCLVQRSGDTRYLALSYVWGQNYQQAAFQTNSSNFDSLCQEGAFEKHSNQARLPETIQDSIVLTQKMGLNYLWVDRFCIVQDMDTKHNQLKEMASIYANAYFTIAACEGYSDKFGLPGVSERRPRSRPFWHIDFGSGCRMISQQPIRYMEPSPLHTRGWTFQEIMLSPRVLSFHHNTVSWKCRAMCQDENGTIEPHYMNEILPTTDCRLSQMPNVLAYADLMAKYSTRDLTYQDDALNAFSAIIAAMGRSMTGGILFGLPELSFSAALLWKPRDHSIRRTDANGMTLKQFPSWSWLGWSGRITTRLWQCLFTFGSEFTIDQRISFFKTKSTTRYSVQINDVRFNKDQHSKIAANSEDPGLLTTRVPLLSNPNDFTREIWETVIEFKTERCFIREGSPYVSNNENDKEGVYLVDDKDNIIGILDYRAQPVETQSRDNTRELICISRMDVAWTWDASRLMKETKLLHKACPKGCYNSPDGCLLGPKWTYKCCNVLWIEWEDDIAYRKAVGRVSQEFWDAIATEVTNIRLG